MFDVAPYGDVVTLTPYTWDGSEDQGILAPMYHHNAGTELTFTPTIRFAYDPIVEYYWDFGDGTFAYGNPDTGEATKTYPIANPGIIAHLRVTDIYGQQAYASMNLMLTGGAGGEEHVTVTAPRISVTDVGLGGGGKHNYDLVYETPEFTITQLAGLSFVGYGWLPAIGTSGIGGPAVSVNGADLIGVGISDTTTGDDISGGLSIPYVEPVASYVVQLRFQFSEDPGWTPPAALDEVEVTADYWGA